MLTQIVLRRYSVDMLYLSLVVNLIYLDQQSNIIGFSSQWIHLIFCMALCNAMKQVNWQFVTITIDETAR